MSTSPRAAFYLRVSTTDQHLDIQEPDVRQVADARGLDVVEVYAEQVSAVKIRPEFDRMMKAARRGRFKVIIVWALDRLHRSMAGAVTTLLELDRLGVQVISVREPWLDTGGPVRSLLVAIFGWVAEQERTRLVERTKAGLSAARRRGVRLGRPPVRVDIEEARRLRGEGKSYKAVAAALGVSVGVVHAALKTAGEAPLLSPVRLPYNQVQETHGSLVFYHRTSNKAAKAILSAGFHDATMTIGGVEVTGVWLSNYPLDSGSGAKGTKLLRLLITVPLSDLTDYEVVNEGGTCREWCVPADIVRQVARVEACRPDEEEAIEVVFPDVWPDESPAPANE